MTQLAPRDDARLARFLAPAQMLREVDELILERRGGYETRQEFFLDAIQNQVLEVKYGSAENGQRRSPLDDHGAETELPDNVAARRSGADNNDPEPASEPAVDAFHSFDETVLQAPSRGAEFNEGLAVPAETPLFGLHNRDYPSIWAAYQLAELTSDGPVELSKFLGETTRRAWKFAAALGQLEKHAEAKLTALFPKNRAKPQSAEESFRAFAIGSLAKRPRDDGRLAASGPLYTWKAIQVVRDGGRLMVGLTDAGHELLERLDGISLDLPHGPEHAERFFDFLETHAPEDAAGFAYLLTVVPLELGRVELAEHFRQWRPTWSESEANTYGAGYVARAREWGLLEPKLIDRRYSLTELGRSWASARSK